MPSLSRLLTAVVFLACLAAAFGRIPPLPADNAALTPHQADRPSELPAFFVSDRLPAVADAVGAASLARLADGRIAAVWRAGPRDEPARAALWFSRLETQGWREPWPIANRESTAGALFAHIAGLGDPVLLAADDSLQLWFPVHGLREGLGSGLVHMRSFDAGDSWSAPRQQLNTRIALHAQRLAGSPRRESAGFGLPVDDDATPPRHSWLHLTVDGRIIGKTPRAAPLPTPIAADSRFALIALSGRRQLLAGNPPAGRQQLQLWLSEDDGAHWRVIKTLESAPDGGATFTDPALLRAPDGRIHLAYTWRQQAIRYASFSEAWLDGAAR